MQFKSLARAMAVVAIAALTSAGVLADEPSVAAADAITTATKPSLTQPLSVAANLNPGQNIPTARFDADGRYNSLESRPSAGPLDLAEGDDDDAFLWIFFVVSGSAFVYTVVNAPAEH